MPSLEILVASIFLVAAASSGPADDRFTREELPDPLQRMLADLMTAGSNMDMEPFVNQVAPNFTAIYDAGGTTSPDLNGFANFASLFGLFFQPSNPDDQHQGWLRIRAFLSSDSFQEADGHICTPYYPPEVSEWDRERLCFRKGDYLEAGYGGWQISYFAYFAD